MKRQDEGVSILAIFECSLVLCRSLGADNSTEQPVLKRQFSFPIRTASEDHAKPRLLSTRRKDNILQPAKIGCLIDTSATSISAVIKERCEPAPSGLICGRISMRWWKVRRVRSFRGGAWEEVGFRNC